MNDYEAGSLIIAIFTLMIALPLAWWLRRRRRDGFFLDVTPGEFPVFGMPVRRGRVSGTREWNGPVAVRFTPPDGLSPAVVGTLLDGRADVVDLSAGLVDLAVKGHYRIVATPPGAAPNALSLATHPMDGVPPPTTPPSQRDYSLVVADPPPPFDGLGEFERQLLADLFRDGPVVRIKDLQADAGLTLRKAQIALYREVVNRGWYAAHPQSRAGRLGCLVIPVIGLGLLFLIAAVVNLRDGTAGPIGLTTPLALFVAAWMLLRALRGRIPRTAEGTAIRIQTLGFREYLTKAEASQIRFDEAAGLFSRYLPYAMVFGVADRWAEIFGKVVAAAQLQGFAVPMDLPWLAFADGVSPLLDLANLVDVAIALDALTTPIEAIAGVSALGDIGATLGDFASSVSSSLDVGDGGGCFDAVGCDF